MPHHLSALLGLAALAALGSGCEFFDWEPDPPAADGGGSNAGTCPNVFPTDATGTAVVTLDDERFGSFVTSVRPIGNTGLELFGCVFEDGVETARLTTLWALPGPVATGDDAVQAVVPRSSAPGMYGTVDDLANDVIYDFLSEGNGLIEVSRWDPAGRFEAQGSITVTNATVSLDLDLQW